MPSPRRPGSYLSHMIRQLLRNRLATICTGISLLSLAVCINISLFSSSADTPGGAATDGAAITDHSPSPLLWVYHKTEQPLTHIINVFKRLGYSQAGQLDDWDVLWSHEYPFLSLPVTLWVGLKPHQKVNHFPGSGCFTFKPQLAIMDLDFIPKAFQLPKQASELLKEAKAHPDYLWVQKSNNHRQIKIVNHVTNMNQYREGSFVQRFISNPLLIDGRKFDIGIYTVITSVRPLRVYTYKEEILVRFCSKDYIPFNTQEQKKYVVDDMYTRPSEVRSMAPLLSEQAFSNKEALNILLERQGFKPTDMWEQVSVAIRKVLLSCESSMISHIDKLSSDPRHFFELVRFDFVVDDQLKAWLMEVNLSPNLSSDHFSENRHMYEKVVFNVLSLVGLARPAHNNLKYNGQFESAMFVNEYNIQVPLPDCVDGSCNHCADHTVCKLCKPCQNNAESFVLKMAFLEHVSRRGFTRIYPPPTQLASVEGLSPANRIMTVWFAEKCKTDLSWCS